MSSTENSTPPITKFLVIDAEGYFSLDGLRVSDIELGRDWLSQLQRDARGRITLRNEPSTLIEAFDQPLVALDISVATSNTHSNNQEALQLTARFPYGFEANLLANSLRVDEWDRFYARTENEIPVVFSRSAQSRFFQEASDFDDDSISFGAHRWSTPPLFEEFAEASNSTWWSGRYKMDGDRWDLGEAHPLLDTVVPPLKFSRSRVLVLGCGAGHDAAWWSRRGHIVTGVDFSEEALSRAKEKYGESDSLKWVHADVFKLPASWTSRFDIIFEHTMFCAITPSRREDLVRLWWRLLSPRGRLMGFIPVMDKLSGPPFGASEWEFRRRLLEVPQQAAPALRRARFFPLLWNRERRSIEKRLGQELFFVVERADSLTE